MQPDSGQWHRLHPSSLLFQFTASVRQLVVPGLTVLVLGASNDWAKWELYLMPIVILVMVAQLVRYFSLRYRFDEGELVVKQGIFARNERHVPFDRIQNIDLIQKPLQRMFHVAEVRLQTASGSEPEAVLRVLSMQAVEEMRSRVRAGRDVASPRGQSHSHPEEVVASAVDPSSQSSVIVRLGFGDLIRLGLIQNRGMIFVAAAMGLMFQFNWYEKLDIGGVFSSGKTILEGVNLGGWMVAFAVVAAVVMGVLLLEFMSIAWAVFRFFGFTLEQVGRSGDGVAVGFRTTAGLYTKHTATVPARRIQFISVRTSPLARLFKRSGIRIETAGAAGNGNEQTNSGSWFVPILPDDDVQRVLALVQPGLQLDASADGESVPHWQQLSKRARWRMIKRAVRGWLVLAVIVSVVAWPYGLASAVLPVIGVWYARRSWARTAYAITDDRVFFRSGIVVRSTSSARIEKIQAVSINESFFDRRWGMASLNVDTAGAGPAGHRISIECLDRSTADAMAARLAAQAESSPFEW